MSYTRASRDAAEREAAERNRGTYTTPTEYRVAPYPDCNKDQSDWSFGVQRWHKYADRPELGWIFGGFVWRKEV